MDINSQQSAVNSERGEPPVPLCPEPSSATITRKPDPSTDTATYTTQPAIEKPAAPVAPSVESRAGRYRLDDCLGRGSFGEVWKGYDPVLDVVVAVKVPRSDRCFSQAQADEFVEEARKQAKLDHPAIVKIRHIEREGSSWLIVSDFIDGANLRDRLETKRFSFEESARIVADIADALDCAHRQRLIHRDVKPANILLDKKGRPYLTDFGLALREQEQQRERNTIAGTWAYMSPEQMRGEAHFLDGRTDIYGLGVVLYELLTGERPFRGETFDEFFEQIVSRPPKPPRAINASIPRELERICLKCLAKSAEDRYATAADLAQDLRQFLRPCSRRPCAVAIVGVAGLLLALATVLPWVLPHRPEHANEENKKDQEKPKSEPVATPVRKSADGWMPLWDREPVKLVWPSPRSLLTRIEREESILASVETDGLFKIGEVSEPTYVFRVNVKLYRPDTYFGILLGYRYGKRDGQDVARFEMIRLAPNYPGAKSKYLLSHFSGDYSEIRAGVPGGKPHVHELIEDLPARGFPLEIAVVDNRLAWVRFDQKLMPKLKETPDKISDPQRTWLGAICVYVRDATCHLHRPEVALKKIDP